MNQDMLDEYTARNNRALETLVNTHGVILKRLPDDVLKKFKDITSELLEELIAEDPLSKRIFKSQENFKKNVSEYHKISEKAVYEMRELN